MRIDRIIFMIDKLCSQNFVRPGAIAVFIENIARLS